MPSKSYIFLLRGGLGNQLFQLCALGQLSRHLDLRFYISDVDTHALTRGSGGTESLKLEFDSLFDLKHVPIIMGSRTHYFVKCLIALNKRVNFPMRVYTDSVEPLSLGRFGLVQGYFQNFKIPASYDLSTLNKFIFGQNDKLIKERITNIACIHVRRSDYPSSETSKFGPKYYRKAIENMLSRGINSFDCYSDDIAAAKALFPKNHKIHISFPEHRTKLDSIELLRRMALYDHSVTSQSSLSWWSAYTAFRNNPKVVIESNWNNNLDFLKFNFSLY